MVYNVTDIYDIGGMQCLSCLGGGSLAWTDGFTPSKSSCYEYAWPGPFATVVTTISIYPRQRKPKSI